MTITNRAAPSSPGPGGLPTGGGAGGGSELARTGATGAMTGVAVVAAVLVLAGAALVGISRRRRRL